MEEPNQQICEIPLELIAEDPAFQFRGEVGVLKDLAESIQLVGQKVPIKVRPLEDGRYQVVYGFRRLQVLKELKKETAWAIVHRDLSEGEALKERFAENSEREPYSPYEWIMVCRQLEAKGYTRGKIAEIIGKSPATVARYFQLLSHPEALELLRRKEVSFREALKSISPSRVKTAPPFEEEKLFAEEEWSGVEEVRFEESSDPGAYDPETQAWADYILGEVIAQEPGEGLASQKNHEEASAIPFPMEPSSKAAYAASPLPPQEKPVHQLIRVVGKSVSEVPFFSPPRISLRILSKDVGEGKEEKVPALDILGLEVEQLLPFFERLKENLKDIR